jgi:uncharacterized membrane protein
MVSERDAVQYMLPALDKEAFTIIEFVDPVPIIVLIFGGALLSTTWTARIVIYPPDALAQPPVVHGDS